MDGPTQFHQAMDIWCFCAVMLLAVSVSMLAPFGTAGWALGPWMNLVGGIHGPAGVAVRVLPELFVMAAAAIFHLWLCGLLSRVSIRRGNRREMIELVVGMAAYAGAGAAALVALLMTLAISGGGY